MDGSLGYGGTKDLTDDVCPESDQTNHSIHRILLPFNETQRHKHKIGKLQPISRSRVFQGVQECNTAYSFEGKREKSANHTAFCRHSTDGDNAFKEMYKRNTDSSSLSIWSTVTNEQNNNTKSTINHFFHDHSYSPDGSPTHIQQFRRSDPGRREEKHASFQNTKSSNMDDKCDEFVYRKMKRLNTEKAMRAYEIVQCGSEVGLKDEPKDVINLEDDTRPNPNNNPYPVHKSEKRKHDGSRSSAVPRRFVKTDYNDDRIAMVSVSPTTTAPWISLNKMTGDDVVYLSTKHDETDICQNQNKLGCCSNSNNSLGLPNESSLKFRVRESDDENLSQVQSDITLTLLNSSLWKAFNRVGTEMIINRGGRRMFPYLSLSVQGLHSDASYSVGVQMIPASTRRCKFINTKWVPVGLADTEPPQFPHYHIDSPSSGDHWHRTKINFSKIKLTNNEDSGPSNILLHSMHKYQIVITITCVDSGSTDSQATNQPISFCFPETEFVAVTAYQNESVTQMKIHNNPFAKAFRDASFNEFRRKITLRKRKNTTASKSRGRQSMIQMDDVIPMSSTSRDEMTCRLVTPLPKSSSMDTLYQWSHCNMPGCLVPQFQGVGYCMPRVGLPGYAGLIYPTLVSKGMDTSSNTDRQSVIRGLRQSYLPINQIPTKTKIMQVLGDNIDWKDE